MKKKLWTMQEDFIFPKNAGVPAGAELVNVTPRYTEERTEDAVRLTGIYHIAANVQFEEGERGSGALDTAILIDDVELDGNGGYFEYAVPLHIDLPPEVGSPLQVVTTSTTNELDGQGSFSVVWDVECSYKEAVAQVEKPASIALTEETSAKEEKSNAVVEKSAAPSEKKSTAVAEKTSAPEKKSTAVAEKTSAAEKKSTAVAEKTSAAEKKSTAVAEKTSAAEKKSTAVAEKTSAAEKKSTAVAEKTSAPEEKSTAVAEKPSVPEEKSIAVAQETEQIVEAEALNATATAENEEIAEEANVRVRGAVAIKDSAYVEESDEALSFIAGLGDGISTTTFRSNNVFVQDKS